MPVRMLLNSALFFAMSFLAMSASALAQGKCPTTVSQAPYITDTIRWLGAEDCLVGVSGFEARSDLPRTGGLMNPDIAAIRKLNPQLIIFADWRKPKDAPEIESIWRDPSLAGIARQRVFGFQTVDQISDNIVVIGGLLKVVDAKKRAKEFNDALARKFAELKGRSHSRKIALLTGCSQGAVVFGADSYIFDLFRRSGYDVKGPGAATRLLLDKPVDDLASYLPQLGVEKVVILDDRVDEECIKVIKKTSIPFHAVGVDSFRSPSPRILSDLDLLGFD